jgi:hypothetical protein
MHITETWHGKPCGIKVLGTKRTRARPKNLDTFWCTGWAWNCQIIFRFASIHGPACLIWKLSANFFHKRYIYIWLKEGVIVLEIILQFTFLVSRTKTNVHKCIFFFICPLISYCRFIKVVLVCHKVLSYGCRCSPYIYPKTPQNTQKHTKTP